MTTTSKKFSEKIDPEISKERIIDALRVSNKLDAAQATEFNRLANAVREHQRQMGASHEAISDQINERAHYYANVVVGDVQAQLRERDAVLLEYLQKLEKPLELVEKIFDIVRMTAKLPGEIPEGEYLEDPEEDLPF